MCLDILKKIYYKKKKCVSYIKKRKEKISGFRIMIKKSIK